MSVKPKIKTGEKQITLTVGNSKENSALLIYDIEHSVNTELKTIELKGFQALKKKYKEKFVIPIKELTKAELDTYEYYWLDPDKTKTLITEID